MEPRFNIERERQTEIRQWRYRNDKCLFQFHSQIEIYFVDEGEMDMFVSGHPCRLQAGQVSVALPYDTHAYSTPSASRSSVLLIPLHLCEDFVTLVKGKHLKTPYITDRTAYDTLKTYYDRIKDPNENPINRTGYLYLLLGTIIEHIGLEESQRPVDNALASRLLFHIAERFKDTSPANIAKEFGYSQSYLARYFKSCFGITLGHYLVATRLRHAIHLLREGKGDLTHCAMESGFTSMRTFYRDFHNHFGCTPSEYFAEHK